MLDLAFIRENPDKVKAAVVNKHDKADVDKILLLDGRRRAILAELEKMRAEKNEASKRIGEMMKKGENADAEKARVRELGDEMKGLDDELKSVEDELNNLLLWVPNVPSDDTPVGDDAAGNVEIRRWGQAPKFDFTPLPHWEIAEKLGMLDFQRASKISGAGFALFTGMGAKLERALINFMIDLHVEKHGYKEVFPPYLVTRDCMLGTGQVPKLEEDMYKTAGDELFLIPTAEVPVTNFYRNEVLNGFDLPIKLTAYTACFRREAGSYGKDTRGLIRVHQFDKVEMVKFADPDKSYAELETLVNDAEDVLKALKLPYRVIQLCTGDLSFSAAKCYDLEVWAAGADRWFEVSSCSNFEAFQARRANIRYKAADGKVRFIHTLNGSGIAMPRTVIAILENYQNADGSVTIPEVLRPYFNGLERWTPQAK